MILFVLAFCFNSLAQTNKTGTISAQILMFNVGPRAIEIGGAFTIDYAYQDFGRLKAVHYFSVGIVF